MKARTETELIADCHGGTEVNLVTALGFYSMLVHGKEVHGIREWELQ